MAAPSGYTAADCDWSRYTAAMLDDVAIGSGTDDLFDGVSEDDKHAIAAYMQTEFAAALKRKYGAASAPASRTLRVRITLTGLETSTPVLSTATKVLPIGLAMNVARTAGGVPAPHTGSVTYAVEIRDAATGQLLRAYASRRYPAAINVVAGVGPLGAAKAGVRDGAEALAAQLR